MYTYKRKPLFQATKTSYPTTMYQQALVSLQTSIFEKKKLCKISQFLSNCIERDNFVAKETCIVYSKKNLEASEFNSVSDKNNKAI